MCILTIMGDMNYASIDAPTTFCDKLENKDKIEIKNNNNNEASTSPTPASLTSESKFTDIKTIESESSTSHETPEVTGLYIDLTTKFSQSRTCDKRFNKDLENDSNTSDEKSEDLDSDSNSSTALETCKKMINELVKTKSTNDSNDSNPLVYNPDEFYDNSAIADQFQSNITTNESLMCDNDSSISSDSSSNKFSSLETAYNTSMDNLMNKFATRASYINPMVRGFDENTTSAFNSKIYNVGSRYSSEYISNDCAPKNMLAKGAELLTCSKPKSNTTETNDDKNENNDNDDNVKTESKTTDDKTIESLSSHYHQGNVEPIDLIESMDLNFNLGNVIKYVARCNYKGQKKEDLLKAKWYLERELKRLE